MEAVHVVVTTSPNYQGVYKYFETSVKGVPNITVHDHMLDLSVYDTGNFHSDGWYYACRQKLINNISFIKENPNIEYVVLSDADIQYFRPELLVTLVQEARKLDLDYYGMREDQQSTYNTGFIIAKNNIKIHDLLQSTIDKLAVSRPHLADQSIINNIIFNDADKNIKHAFIPSKYYTWGDGTPGPDTIFHHAVNIGRIDMKIEQLERVLNRYLIASSSQ